MTKCASENSKESAVLREKGICINSLRIQRAYRLSLNGTTCKFTESGSTSSERFKKLTTELNTARSNMAS
ncbi:Uncharacterised protein [Vibrio cholerae]|nr:Uncharacterised protein [Vibrio cholerae]